VPAVVVTGAASGIGRATAERLVRAGGRVGFVDRNAEALAAVTAALPAEQVLSLTADVSDPNAIAGAVAAAATAFGGLTGLVTSAGIFHPGDMRPGADVERATFEQVLAVNLVGTFLAIQAAMPHLLAGGGAVVTIASTAGLRGHGFGAAYTASKGGVVALTRLLALQYGPRGVRVNCVCPGLTATGMNAEVVRDPEYVRRVVRGIPLGRIATPDEIAGVACHLLGDDSAYVNGQVIAVDGGATVL
jgi:meso-butanediol dehydrogenase/(S,S)-butanediol dehydrogenase/diacetyl reductase